MTRYRALTLRYPHLTEAEHAERAALALAGWHEALVGPGDEGADEVRCWCQRQPGDDEAMQRCAVCLREDAREALGMETVGTINSGEGDTHGLRRARVSAAIGADG